MCRVTLERSLWQQRGSDLQGRPERGQMGQTVGELRMYIRVAGN